MRVLIVEDDVKINAILAQAFQEERYAVDVAHDGEMGEEMAFVNEYDAIILDLMLPKRHGNDVIKELREHGVKTPILVLTARDGVVDRVRRLNEGPMIMSSSPSMLTRSLLEFEPLYDVALM